MSILDMNKTEALSTFNRHVPSGHINKLKAASDTKSDTEELTQANSGLDSSHGLARIEVDKIRDKRILKDELDDWSHCKDIH